MINQLSRIAILAVGMATLPFSAHAAGQLNLICNTDVAWCEKMVEAFTRESGIPVNMVRLSAGETYAKLAAEAGNPKTDIWWGGTGDAHLQAANDDLTMVYRSANLDKLHDWAKKQAESSGYRTVGIYSGALGWGYNTALLERKKISEPLCWADLLRPEMKGEIQIANPNSAGTAYTALASLVQLMGEDEAFAYMAKLNGNVSQYTKSGSAPAKSAARGEAMVGIVFAHDAMVQVREGFPIKVVTPCEGTGYEIGSMSIVKGARNLEEAKAWYEFALKAKTQELGEQVNSFRIPANREAAIPQGAPRMEDIKLINYDFATYGSASVRARLLERWDREIGANAN